MVSGATIKLDDLVAEADTPKVVVPADVVKSALVVALQLGDAFPIKKGGFSPVKDSRKARAEHVSKNDILEPAPRRSITD